MGQENCISCNYGKYSNEIGLSECKKCPKGQFMNEIGHSLLKCNECKIGFYVSFIWW